LGLAKGHSEEHGLFLPIPGKELGQKQAKWQGTKDLTERLMAGKSPISWQGIFFILFFAKNASRREAMGQWARALEC
jgi:hypothetical protein